jgi:mannosyltransferase
MHTLIAGFSCSLVAPMRQLYVLWSPDGRGFRTHVNPQLASQWHRWDSSITSSCLTPADTVTPHTQRDPGMRHRFGRVGPAPAVDAVAVQVRGASIVRTSYLVVVGVVGLAIFLGLHRIGARAFWFDEAYSFAVGRLGGAHLIKAVTTGDPSMGLYYVMLHFWLHLGDSEATIRTLSLIFGAASIPLIFFVGKELFDEQVGVVAAVLLAVNSFFIEQSQEARSYSLALMLVTMSTLVFIHAVRRGGKRRWSFYAVVSVLAVLAHSFSLFILIAHAGTTLLFRARRGGRTKLILITMGILFAAALAAVPVLKLAFDSERWSWIHLLGWRAIGVEILGLFGLQKSLLVAYAFLICVGMTLFVQCLIKKDESEKGWSHALVLGMFFVPVVGSIVGSFIMPMFVLRYLTIALPGLILSVAVGVTRIRPRWISLAVLIMVLALNARSLYRYYEHPPAYKDSPWRAASTFLMSKAQEGDTVLFNSLPTSVLFDYYYRSVSGQSPRLRFPFLPPVLNEGGSELDPVLGARVVAEERPLPRRVWVVRGALLGPAGRFPPEGMGERYRPGPVAAFQNARIQLFLRTKAAHDQT